MTRNDESALQLAALTYKLLSNCQQKEIKLSQNIGLTQAEFRCIRFFQSTEVINNKEIAERMGLSPSRLTRIIDGLVAKGYITREIDPSDRRNMRVCLAQNGLNLVNKMNDEFIELHKQVMSNLDEKQANTVVSLFSELFDKLETWVGSL